MFKHQSPFLDSRRSFERNIYILAQMIKHGRMKYSAHMKHTTDSLLKIAPLPNGRIDFNTVNESARLSANSAANFQSKFEVE